MVSFFRLFIKTFDEAKVSSELPIPEPGDLINAKAVDLEAEKAEIKKLETRLRATKTMVAKIKESVAEDEKQLFGQKMETFIAKAEEEIKELASQSEEISSLFTSCLKYFKFTPKKGKIEEAKPNEFFEPWSIFCEDFKSIWKKEQVKMLKQRMKEKRKVELQRSASLRAGIGVSNLIFTFHLPSLDCCNSECFHE